MSNVMTKGVKHEAEMWIFPHLSISMPMPMSVSISVPLCKWKYIFGTEIIGIFVYG